MQGNKFLSLFIVFFLFQQFSFCQLQALDDNHEKIAKLRLKTEKRKIKQGTHILSFYAVNNQYPLIIKDPSLLLSKEISKGFPRSFGRSLGGTVDALYINYQYTLPKNFFVESGFQYLKYWTNFRTDEWVSEMFDNVSGFSTFSFSLGGGYRFIGENNLRFFDIHTGFTLGVTDNKIGSGQSHSYVWFYQDGNGNAGVMNYSWQYRITSRYSLGFYLGISKDIRINENLYVSARYHYQFGKNSELTEHIINYDLPTIGINNSVRASVTAKGQMFGLGLRWLFDRKQE